MKIESVIKRPIIYADQNVSGIYAIYNSESDKIYIGQALSIYRRWRVHKCKLARKTHVNRHLQAAWNKYSEECFFLFLLEECEKNDLNSKEEFYLSLFNPKQLYNQKPVGSSRRHYICSEETRRKISEANKKRFQDPEQRAKLTSLRLGTKLTEEHKLAISLANKGQKKPPRTPEHIAKLSLPKSLEAKRKMSEARKKYLRKIKNVVDNL